MRILIKLGIADFDSGNEIRRLLDRVSFARRTLQECMEWLLASTQVQAEDDADANVDADADDDVDADASDADTANGADTGETEY